MAGPGEGPKPRSAPRPAPAPAPAKLEPQAKNPPESRMFRAAREKQQKQTSEDLANAETAEITPEKIANARKAINWALDQMKNPIYQELFKKHGIILESADYYLNIAIKESRLNPLKISNDKAKGLFQIKTDQGYVLDDIKTIFGLNIKSNHVFYLPEKTKNRKKQIIEKKRLDVATANNAFVGILASHIWYETTSEHYRLWSIADKLLIHCATVYNIDYCKKNSTPNGKKIRLLVEIIRAYNVKMKNPDFVDSTDDEKEADVKIGGKVYLPARAYLEAALGKAHGEVKNESIPIQPGKVPMYAGVNAAKLEKIGNQLIAPPKNPPKIIIPRYRQASGEYMDPYAESNHGRMPKSKTQGIIIHSTEGTQYPWLYEDQNIHYILKRNGTLELVHSPEIAVSHCGSMKQSPWKQALWNGERAPSYHFVGIEVENLSMSSLLRNELVAIYVEPKAKIVSKNIRGKIHYFTSTAPSQRAMEAAYVQAGKERGFTDVQYEVLKNFIAHVGSQKGLHKKDVLTHSQIAITTPFKRVGKGKKKKVVILPGNPYRGRKSDPPVLDWERIGLPNNYLRVDPDVATGKASANLAESERIRNTKGITFRKSHGEYEVFPSKDGKSYAYYFEPQARFGAPKGIVDGVKAADEIQKAKKNKNKK